jgi:hypothetical protein
MSHIHWVAQQNKLEIPNDEEDVNTREIHKYDGQAHDRNTMVDPLTPKPTRKAKALVKVSPTIASRHEEDVALKMWQKQWLCCANGILETKANDGNTTTKTPVPRTNPNTKEVSTTPNPHTHPSHERDWQARNPGVMTVPPTLQADTKNRNPHQGAADHCLTSRYCCCLL